MEGGYRGPDAQKGDVMGLRLVATLVGGDPQRLGRGWGPIAARWVWG